MHKKNQSKQSKYVKQIKLDGVDYNICDIKKAALDCNFDLEKLPYSLRILFENVARNNNDCQTSLYSFKNWLEHKTSKEKINYMPTRVLMQDFTGVPAIVDLASMRDAMKLLGDDPKKINPMIPVDLVIDHSVQVDFHASLDAFENNVAKEIERNKERYEFLKWGQKNFSNFRVVPPGTGICHQVNLEYLAQTIHVDQDIESNQNSITVPMAYPDSLVGTDSHTTMINALAVLGWGVGGIEAEAAMLGRPLPMILPEVIGFKMTGTLNSGITATDLVLTITQMLRQHGVVGKFVEFFGPALENLSLADRATISNMAPEYGATCGFFPIDAETIKYLRFTKRNEHRVKIVEEYSKIQKMWRDDNTPIAEYTDILELDISNVETSLAGPKNPQDRIALSNMKDKFAESFDDLFCINNSNISKQKNNKEKIDIEQRQTKEIYLDEQKYLQQKYLVPTKDKESFSIGHCDVVIAAITSCTNTSNPSVMIAAGIVAKKATELGIKVKPWVKTSLAPGSKVVTEYLKNSGLEQYLNELGFNLVGYGCTTCIGNSGPLEPSIEQIIKENNLVVSSVLSGNRNFEGRVHQHVKANYLASPPLVVAYSLAGTVNIDFEKEPIGTSNNGKEIYLKDIWPNQQEIQKYMDSSIKPEMFLEKYKNVFEGDQNWKSIPTEETSTYNWQESSTYIKNPPYFDKINEPQKPLEDIQNARILALFGDSITTDHISPAGAINKDSPAAKFLVDHAVFPNKFNSYGSRRGNHEIMMRGTFANIRIKNQICENTEGGVTVNHLTKEQMSIYDAAMDYKKHSVPLVIFAGKAYGTGSSRDWAAKGTNLLGVKAVIAESFERIHRSNLVGMGVLPISFESDMSWKKLLLKGDEKITIEGINDNIKPYQSLKCIINYNNGKYETINMTLQVHTDNEIEYIKHDSILEFVIKNISDK